MDLPSVEFLTETGQLQAFQPALKGAPVGFVVDGRSMGAWVSTDIHVFDLPSLSVRYRIDVRLWGDDSQPGGHVAAREPPRRAVRRGGRQRPRLASAGW
jgi:hypothetical protein